MSKHPHPDEYVAQVETRIPEVGQSVEIRGFARYKRHPSRLARVVESLVVYALAAAMSFAFWYALFVAVAER